jgi:hypothetical protein
VSATGTSGIWRILTEFDARAISGKHRKAVYVFMGLLALYVIVRGIVGAASRILWYDELLTLTIAGQPTLHDLWTAVKTGVDSAPPLFYLVERAALGLTSNKQVALRLPSIFAFPCTLICLFVYARKRNGELLACLCALLFLSTSLYHTYLIEARAYSMVIACIAFALLCYQRIPAPHWTALFAASLVLAGSLHYYAIFAMIPFWVAEGLVFAETKKFRWPTWIALTCGMLPLTFFWPLLMKIKTNYGSNLLFARPSFSAVRGYYATLFLLKENAVGITLAILAVAGIVWSCLSPRKSNPKGQGPEGEGRQGAPEAGLLLSFVALPFITFVLINAVHGLLLARYVMAATIGLALGITMAVSIAGRKAAMFFAVFVFCLVAIRESSFWLHPEFDPFIPYFSATSAGELQGMREFIQSAGHTDLPVAISDSLLYSQFVYYLEPSWTNRLVYLTDEQRELRYARSDSSSKNITFFAKLFPLQVRDYSQFTANHAEFLFYSEGGDWYMPAFLGDGFSLQLIASYPGHLYLVRVKESAER